VRRWRRCLPLPPAVQRPLRSLAYVGGVAGGLDVEWRRDLHMSPTSHGIKWVDGALLASERTNRVVRLDPLAGEPIWEASVDGPWGSLAVGNGVGVYVNQRGQATCLELASGAVRWVASVPRGYVAIVGSAVLFGGWRGYSPLSGRDLASGEPLWSRSRSENDALLWPLPTAEGALVTARGSVEMQLIEPRSGAVQQRWTLPDPVPSGDLDEVLSKTMDGLPIFRLGEAGVAMLLPSGVEVVWQHPTALSHASPAVHDRHLWLSDTSGPVVVDLGTRTSHACPLQEGVAPGVVCDSSGALFAGRAGVVVHISPDGAVTDRKVLSRRSVAVVGGGDGLAYLALKGELICLRLGSPSAC